MDFPASSHLFLDSLLLLPFHSATGESRITPAAWLSLQMFLNLAERWYGKLKMSQTLALSWNKQQVEHSVPACFPVAVLS